jgi:hypothetical protein
MKGKKAQVTIFIILGLIIIVLILIFLSFKRPPPSISIDQENPQSFIDSCAREALDEAIEIVSKQGGDIKLRGSIPYNGANRSYLCYTQLYYEPCTNQKPMLVNHVRNEIYNYVSPKLDSCFKVLEEDLKKIYEVDSGPMEFNVEFSPNSIEINIDKKLNLKKEDLVKNYEEFQVKTASPLYELLDFANEIANQEAQYCYFNVNGFNSNYPQFNVKKEMIRDSKIYTVKNKHSNQAFTFAIRSCAMPAGL